MATQLAFEVERDALDAIVARNRDTTVSRPITSESGGVRALLRDPDGHLLCLELKDGASQQPANRNKAAIALMNNMVPVT